MSKAVLQFIELVRQAYYRRPAPRAYWITCQCDNCRKIVKHECEVRGDFEYRTCSRCRSTSSHKVSGQ